MEFEYRVKGNGWAWAQIDGEQFTVSYLTDALGDLLRAALQLLDGAEDATCLWRDEPGEFRWWLVRLDDEVIIQIRDEDADDPEPLYETRESVTELARAVAAGAAQELARLGAEEYQKQWLRHPFPTAELAELQRRL